MVSLFLKQIHIAVTQNIISIFRVWYGESKDEGGAVGGRSASTSGDTTETQQQKVLVGRASGEGNYKF